MAARRAPQYEAGEHGGWKAAWDDDFRAGFGVGKKSSKIEPPLTAYKRGKRGQRHGSEWMAGHAAASEEKLGLYENRAHRRAEDLGLIKNGRSARRRKNPIHKRKTNMAARKKKTTTRRRRTVRRASNPRARSTRKGQLRRTSRRAYTRTRRATRRRNPSPKVIGTPAFKFGLQTIGGAIAGSYVDANSNQGQIFSALRPAFLPAQLAPSFLAALLTYTGAAFFVKKARTRQMLVAVGTGMLLPTVARFAMGAVARVESGMPNALANGNGEPVLTTTGIRRRITRGPSLANYSSANAFVGDLIPG